MTAQAERLEKEFKAWSCGHDEPRGGAPWCVDCVIKMVKRIKMLERDLRWITDPNRHLFGAPYSKEIIRIGQIRKRVAR